MKKLDELYKKLPDCNECELCNLSINQGIGKLKGNGNPERRILFVAQNPSYWRNTTEVLLSKSKPMDLLFQKFMKKVGLPPENFFYTNIVKCSTMNNKAPEFEVPVCFRKWLLNEIMIIRPKLIVCVGAVAKNWFMGRWDTLTDYMDFRVFSIFHPASINYQPEYKEVYLDQFKHLKKLIDKIEREAYVQRTFEDDK